MLVRLLSRVCGGLVLTCLLVTACADEDPRYGGAGAIENVKVFDTPGAGGSSEGGGNLTAPEAFGVVWKALKLVCGSCHIPPGAQGAPPFFGTDEASSYTAFKAKNYHLEGGKPPTSTFGLVERGAHLGPALDAEDLALVKQWRAAEAKAGGTADAGGN